MAHHDRCIRERVIALAEKVGLLQADVEILDWPPRAPDMNPIENMWSEVKRTMQETWPALPPRNSDEL